MHGHLNVKFWEEKKLYNDITPLQRYISKIYGNTKDTRKK